MDQVWLFYEAAQENLRQEMLSTALIMRAAFSADRRGWQKLIESLTKKSSVPIPREAYRQLKELLDGR